MTGMERWLSGSKRPLLSLMVSSTLGIHMVEEESWLLSVVLRFPFVHLGTYVRASHGYTCTHTHTRVHSIIVKKLSYVVINFSSSRSKSTGIVARTSAVSRLRKERWGFKASLGYIERKLVSSQTKQNKTKNTAAKDATWPGVLGARLNFMHLAGEGRRISATSSRPACSSQPVLHRNTPSQNTNQPTTTNK